MIDIIKRECCKYIEYGYYYGPKISKKREVTARECLNIPSNEEVIALVDSTITGNSKKGVAICTTGIYWTNPWSVDTNINYISWENFINCKFQIKSGNIDLGNGGIIECGTIQKTVLLLFEDIRAAIKHYLLCKEPQNSDAIFNTRTAPCSKNIPLKDDSKDKPCNAEYISTLFHNIRIIDENSYAAHELFKMKVDHILNIENRGTAVAGVIEKGYINIRDIIEINSNLAIVIGISLNNNLVYEAWSGESVYLLLKGINASDIQNGSIINGILK